MTGKEHPLSIVLEEAVSIFIALGFEVALGPEIEDEWHNFDALNIPESHPARDMQDTFWLKNGKLLRTHTSPVQIRYMENHQPPFAIIVPGKVFRNEATDATHEAQFFQLEGLAVGENVSLANLKWVLTKFFKKFLGPESEIRFRPSYFPFVEPGLEVDVKYGDRWLEVVGAGLVHPNVLKNGKIAEKYQGFAFGLGLDRLMMIKYGIPDIRLSYQGDLRLNQF